MGLIPGQNPLIPNPLMNFYGFGGIPAAAARYQHILNKHYVTSPANSNTLQYITIHYNTIHYNTILYNTSFA